MLNELIERYKIAQKAWLNLFEDAAAENNPSPEWDAYERAEAALLYYPCKTIEEVQIKAAFILGDANAFDSVKNCFRTFDGKEVHVLSLFLQSLLGEAPVDCGGN
ncbi:hypothetical protein [Rhizobium sp. YTU87027]|uniref:hypothetical protein n=1 Tax=Rhizobium sp. YTU87027 TaxID=3417741 RepID=UPI003D68807B